VLNERRQLPDGTYRLASLVLFGIAFAARYRAVHWVSLEKTIAMFLLMILSISLSLTIMRLVGRLSLLLPVARYLPWVAAVGVAVYYLNHSPLAPLPLLFLASVFCVVDSRKQSPALVGPVLLLATVLLAIISIDAVWERLAERSITENIPDPFRIRDELLGYKAVPHYEGRAIHRVDEQTAYDVTIRTDEFSRRRSTRNQSEEESAKHAIFMGCSFTFGQGVNDWETLPSQFADNTDGHVAHNYGLGGYGPQQM